MKLLSGRTALITGGSDGIGFAIADAFAKQGANLLLIARNKEKLDKSQNKLIKYGTNIFCISKDIANKDAIFEISKQVGDNDIQINIIVNNAGIGRFIPFADSDESVLVLNDYI